MRKKLLAVVLVAAMAVSMAACGKDSSGSQEGGSKDTAKSEGGQKVGWSLMSTSDAVIAQAISDARDKADELGMELLVSDAENDATKQLNAVENFIESGCDCIVIQAIDATSMSKEAQKARDKGIKVIAYGIGLDNCDVWYKNDNTVAGTAIGKMAADWINENLDGKADVCIIGYSLMEVLVERADAIEAAIKKECPDAEIVAEFDAIDSSTGMSSTESMLAAHPNVNVICSISDGPGVGAYEAVKSAGLDTDKFGIFGSDLSTVALGYISAGTCYRGTTDTDNMICGSKTVEMAYDLITGEKVDEVVTMGVSPVTIENVSDYKDFMNK